jgi:type II secretory pathway pseudopilin PulG
MRPRYTAGVKTLIWLVILACLAGIAFTLWRLYQRQAERRRESEQRAADLLAEAIRAKAKTPGPGARD